MSKDGTITVKNSYFEQIHTVGRDGRPVLVPTFQTLMEKDVFPKEYKPRYWLSKCTDKAVQDLNHYLEAKRDLLKRHAKKHDKDGKKTDDKGKVIREWKKGDIVVNDLGDIEWENFELYTKELEELRDIEVDFGIQKIKCDWSSGPDVTQREMQIIMPFLEEPQDQKAEPAPGEKKKEKGK